MCVRVKLYKSAIISVARSVATLLIHRCRAFTIFIAFPFFNMQQKKLSMPNPVSAVHVFMKCHDIRRYTSLRCFSYPRDICTACSRQHCQRQAHWLSARGRAWPYNPSDTCRASMGLWWIVERTAACPEILGPPGYFGEPPSILI